MTRTLISFAALSLVATSARAGRPKCDDAELLAGLSRVAASNELQRSALASVIVAQACDDAALHDAIQATLDDDASVLITYGTDEARLWSRVCPGITPDQVTSELTPTGCTVAHLGWSDMHFATSMTAAALSDDATAAPFQFSPALAAQQVARALSAQTLARSRSTHRQAYLDAMAPVSTDERQQRAVRTAFAGLSRPSRGTQSGPLLGGRGGLLNNQGANPEIGGLSTGTVTVTGSLEASAIHDTLRPQLPALRACTPDAGTVTVRLNIQRDGTVSQSDIKTSTLPAANDCILDIVRPLQFPEAGSDVVIVEYPLEFRDAG